MAGWRARYAQAQLLALARLAAQAPEQQFDHLQVLGLGRIEQAALHRPARVAHEEFGEFVGPVAVGVDMGAFDLVQDVLARQHLLRHLAEGDVHEGVELRGEVDVLPVQGGEDDATGPEIQSLDGLLRRGCGGHRRVS